MYYSTEYLSPIGALTLACNGDNLVGLWVEGQKYYGGTIPQADGKAMQRNDDMPVFAVAKNWLDKYFAGQNPDIAELPLAPIGGDFRQYVWGALREIPYGKVVSYGDIAKKVAAKMNRDSMSSQAVGGAVGHNPIAVIIPCHRVVASNGSLTGFASGIDRKIKLLELEGTDMSGLFAPTKGTAL
ncbi:MAG: methylated-DNA--[protein]-cysteine S-methyltransferase [Spirochaetes bacterium]|nr:methylated-DNA--[protein]-cysteine S-methyltransferase [Spirochaetota bacterium]